VEAEEQDHRDQREQQSPTDKWLSPKQLRWFGYCGVVFSSLFLALFLLLPLVAVDGVLDGMTVVVQPVCFVNMLGLIVSAFMLRSASRPLDHRHLRKWLQVFSLVFTGACSATIVASLLLGHGGLSLVLYLGIGLAGASVMTLATVIAPRLWKTWETPGSTRDGSKPPAPPR